MKIGQIGEFNLIERMHRLLPPTGRDVLVGIGDDVAVLKADEGYVWLATCDVQMERVHFQRKTVRPRDLGRKALAINLSDIAATGGTPRFALVSLGLPENLAVEFVDELYAGLSEESAMFGVDIVGGNLTRSGRDVFIDIFLMGETAPQNIVLRSGAQVGDLILTTGTLGDAAAGLALILDPSIDVSPTYGEWARSRQRVPTPRVKEGEWIGTTHLASAMLDISDGLAGDLAHLCERSSVGARIFAEKLPASPDNRALARRVRGDEWYWALHGGEDYELLLTAPARRANALVQGVFEATGTEVSVIGEVLPAEQGRRLLLPDGHAVALEPSGWDHFGHERTKAR